MLCCAACHCVRSVCVPLLSPHSVRVFTLVPLPHARSFNIAFWSLLVYGYFFSPFAFMSEGDMLDAIKQSYLVFYSVALPVCGVGFAGLGLFVAGKQLCGKGNPNMDID